MSPAPRSSPARELAAATSALVESYDITDILAAMLEHTLTAVGADAAALLVGSSPSELELLSSTSHVASAIEVYQAQTEEGPCVDCLRDARPVGCWGEEDIVSRWPTVGPSLIAAGYHGVHAQPLVWQGRALGGLNVFFAGADALTDDARAVLRAFGDIATLALVQTQRPSDRELARHIGAALDARTVVEQAKGVLMQTRSLDPGEAYLALRSEAVGQGVSVTEMSRNLVWRASSR